MALSDFGLTSLWKRRVELVGRVLRSLSADPSNIWRIIDVEGEWRNRVIGQHDLENGLPEIDLLDLVGDFRETVEPFTFLEGTSSPIDIGLLKALARRYSDCRYLEIGTWRGESVANVADVAKECVTVNLSEEQMRERSLPTVKQVFLRGLSNITRIEQDSKLLDFSSLGKFDLVFIDGDQA